MNSLDIFYKECQERVENYYKLSISTLPTLNFSLNVEHSKEDFGHASWNIALVLGKVLKKNPQIVAQEIIEALNSHPLLATIKIAGPGFLNFFFKDIFFSKLAYELAQQGHSFFKPSITPLHYSLEFVSANPTGPLHLGHGRNAIIGDVLGRILKFIGHKVTTEFYINDAGSQISKLGHALKIRVLQLLGHSVELPEDSYQGQYLKDLAEQCLKEYEADVINQNELFFSSFAKNRLLERIKNTLHSYGVTFDVWFSEQTLHENNAVEALIEELHTKGLLYSQDNALWFRSTTYGDDKDRVVKKADGEYTYLASDVAYLHNKLERGFQKLIMILGQDHHSYAVRMKALMSALDHNPEDLSVILYQLVTLKEDNIPVRMSKRSGKIISLEDIIETVGKDVARFFYLHRKAEAHLEFDIGLALKKNEENPVYYIQYAYVRTGSILEKAQAIPELNAPTFKDLQNFTVHDTNLIKKIVSLKTLLTSLGTTHQTHLLAYYTQELAQEFHHYYAQQRVIDVQDSNLSRHRLFLITLVRMTLKTCLDLLGLEAPVSM